jgi:uncharacterized protein YwgA
MQTITIDIINEKAMALLEDLEKLELIHLHNDKDEFNSSDFISRFKGAMEKQPIEEVNKQLSELRNAWE